MEDQVTERQMDFGNDQQKGKIKLEKEQTQFDSSNKLKNMIKQQNRRMRIFIIFSVIVVIIFFIFIFIAARYFSLTKNGTYTPNKPTHIQNLTNLFNQPIQPVTTNIPQPPLTNIYTLPFLTSQPTTYKASSEYTQLGNKQKFYLNLSNLKVEVSQPVKKAFESYDSTQIQIGSNFDLGLTQKINFQNLENELEKEIKSQVLNIVGDKRLEDGERQKIVQEKFKTIQDMQLALAFLTRNNYQAVTNQRQDLQYNLAIQLVRKNKLQEALQVQYYLAETRYGISQYYKQNSICIFSMQYNIFTKNRYKQYFETIQFLNYSNYHIVYVDDFSTDNSSYKIKQYVQNSNFRLKNKIKIVRNLQKLGQLANMFFHIKKHCLEDDIVVIIDADDGLIGKQAFKILNSVYQSPQTWYAYSSYLISDINTGYIYKGSQSKYLQMKTSDYRNSFVWQTSHMRTFRKKLLNSVPLYSLMQYHYNTTTGFAWPAFYSSAGDLFLTFSMFELAGNNRIVHIDQFFYNYYGSASNKNNCFRQHQIYDDYKSRLKTPLKKILKIGEKGQMMKYYSGYKIDLGRIKSGYESFVNCLNSNKPKG